MPKDIKFPLKLRDLISPLFKGFKPIPLRISFYLEEKGKLYLLSPMTIPLHTWISPPLQLWPSFSAMFPAKVPYLPTKCTRIVRIFVYCKRKDLIQAVD